MATIASLKQSLGVLKGNPKLFAVGLLLTGIVLPQTGLSVISGLLALPVQMVTFFITPFVLAGLLGMAYEGRVRPTDFGTFKQIGKDRYVPLLLANFIKFLISAAFGVVGFMVAIFTVGLTVASADSANLVESVGIIAIVLFVLLVLVTFVVFFFLQFYPAAIVADDVGAVEAYKRSVGLVRANIVPSLGYGFVNLVVSLATAAPVLFLLFGAVLYAGSGAGAESALGGSGGVALTAVGGILVYFLVVNTLLTPFRSAFMVCFYDNHRPAHFE